MSKVLRSLKGALTHKFEYGYAKVKDFKVNSQFVPADNTRQKAARIKVASVEVNGEELVPSKRFWTSLQQRFAFSANIFRYFDHAELFDRISARSPNDQVRFCVEREAEGKRGTLLAVTNPANSAVRNDQLQSILEQYGTENATYSNGVVRSFHKPRVGCDEFKIEGDGFTNQFVIDTPIDGLGKPNIYLALLRTVCSNGAIGYTKAFRSELSIGKKEEDVQFALARAMDGFNNEEGFAAMRERFVTATRSWASVNEAQKLYMAMMKTQDRGGLLRNFQAVVTGADAVSTIETAMPLFTSYREMIGDISQIYGLANMDSLSSKRQRTLPTTCTVYDLLNFATEVATHHCKPEGSRILQAYVGDLIANEFDLENTRDQYADWRDFFIKDASASDTLNVLAARRAG